MYINQQLSVVCYKLLKDARKLRQIGYDYVWVKDGRVLVRKENGSKVVQIKNHNDIDSLIDENQ